MPKPAKAETEPEVVIKPSELAIESPQPVEIDETTGKKVEPSSDDTYREELEKTRNQLFYELRQAEKRQKDHLDQVLSQLRQPANTEPKQEPDELDQIAEKDWKKAVSMLAEKEAQKIIQDYQKKATEEAQSQKVRETALQIEERSKQRILSEFPELLDERSPQFKAYMEVFNREALEDPSFLHNPRKHDIVASTFRPKFQGMTVANPEVERLRRVAAGSSAPSRPVSQQNRIMLTQEEIELCDKSSIPYNVYAANRDRLAKNAFKEGVEIKP